jgi:hypothetical protein
MSGELLAHLRTSPPQLRDLRQPLPNHRIGAAMFGAIRYDHWTAVEKREQPQNSVGATGHAIRAVREICGL